MAAEPGSALAAALRELIRQVVREELRLVDGKPGDTMDAAADDDIAQLAAQLRGARLRAAPGTECPPPRTRRRAPGGE
jgi:hypothetical protein